MRNLHTTEQVRHLCDALQHAGISAKMECADGHKHVDICIHDAKLYLEVEGPPHFLSARQIQKDFERDGYSSKDGYETFRIPNQYIQDHLYKLVGALMKVVDNRNNLRNNNY